MALLDSVSGVDELRQLGSRLPPAGSVSRRSAEITATLYARAPRDSRGTHAAMQRELDRAAPH